MSPVLFIFKAVNKHGTFSVTGPDGKDYGKTTSIGPVMNAIARDYPLETLINFRWDYSKAAFSFEHATVERWLRATATSRGVKKDQIEREIEVWRQHHAAQWAA